MSEQNYRVFWEEALKQIHDEYKSKGLEDEFSIWFKMEYVEDTLSTITVSIPSEFMWKYMIDKGYVSAVQNKIHELTGQTIDLTYIVKTKPISFENNDSPSTTETSENQQINQPSISETDNTIGKEVKEKIAKKHPQLREDYTFNTFVPGDNSVFAYNASLAVAKNPGKAYNPILIYGGVGLGKTHLMQSIGNYIYSEKGDSIKICYVSAENFTNEFTAAIGNKTLEKFKSKYRKLDVLLLDDIHFLQGKHATQEELFYTFEELYNNKKQMVFTCDRPITELKEIEDRLRTRFSRGMSIDLQPPNYETRRAILEKKLSILGKVIPSNVVDYIAKNVQTNVRDLESCLNKMIGYSELINKNLTIEIAQEQLRDTFSQPSNGSITIETIQKVVADHYNISISDIKSKKRDKKFVIPRQIAIYISRQITEYSFPELGNEFGGRDHTTAMHSYDKVEEQLKTDSSLTSTIQLLIREIKDYKK
jgi:chromosomal replication initiator protein